ncbi:MAG TPA: polyribonucleotide nucleotidyltransferase [Anaerolineales bacterium]|nr:polyribonucleotide nucleotidyltransferase [Anaerolineales bacterium]
MLENRTFRTTVAGQAVTIETGKLAGQAGGAATIRMADTLVLATATMSRTPREGIDFFPLSVDYEERLYAGGRIPGSFFRREGRPSEAAILTSRLTDRPLRPLFPKDMRNDVQVLLYALSSDGETPIDMLCTIGASAALTISDIPFAGPVGAVRVGRIDGQFVFFPTYQQTEASDLDLRMAGTRDAILMVECGANEIEEAVMVQALEAGHRAIQPLIDLQDEMRTAIGKPKTVYLPHRLPEDAQEAVRRWAGRRIDAGLENAHSKEEHATLQEELAKEAIAHLGGEAGYPEPIIRAVLDEMYKESVRRRILEHGARPDGRKPDGLRPLSAEVDLSPRAHGSGLFTRGETQVLTMATLGTPRERQELDGLSPADEKRYMHHYNFPPFSTGEVRPLRGSSRREIGHGALAERALLPVLPPETEFPYTLRLVSEVLSSNGSTSMASVCGSTLALLDTGVPIRAPVGGIAMGLIKDDNRHVILTDIQGVEDHLGDMDFKVAGTRKGITALQMDIKISGLTSAIMSQALDQARKARLQVLDVIQAVMPAPRAELKPHAPRMTVLKIDPEKIGTIIGPGGKMIRSIQDQTGARIDIEDDGSVFIAAADGPSAQKARELIEGLIEEAVVGRIYTGKVVRVTDFGAFIQILPNTDGLVHISQLDSHRVEKVEDVARVGDEITVMVTNIDSDGRIRLSRQAVLEGWTPEEAMEHDRGAARRPAGGGGRPSGRGGGRGRPEGGGRGREGGGHDRQR